MPITDLFERAKLNETEYISAKATAVLVRKALKNKFPNQKFWVRTKTYAGGASVYVNWIGGPSEGDVKSIVQVYEGSDFDGMSDCKVHKSHWRLPDGSIQLRTQDSMYGQDRIENDRPHPDAQKVVFGADYISCSRQS